MSSVRSQDIRSPYKNQLFLYTSHEKSKKKLTSVASKIKKYKQFNNQSARFVHLKLQSIT